MKYFKSVVFLLAVCALALSPFEPFMAFANTALPHIQQSTEMRGLWVTSAYNLDWPSRQGLTPAQHRAEIDDILTRAANQGINAVFVQVRPMADALYRSDIFPWSHLLTGTQGQAPAGGFDPLAYWIEAAHSRGIQVHAWLNPYRVTFPNQNITNPAQLAANHPARLDPSLVIAYGTSLFFDPGNPAARQLIVDGAAEILRNYNIDGIHLDDYFYPSQNFPDGASFARYGAGMTLHDWRRENVNALVRELQAITHEINPNASFGVSPFAIWKNNDRDPRGSATGGMESYVTQFADTRRWVVEGWVDYIVPQIYWIEGNAAACYEAVLSWWEDLVAGTDVRLYIGLAPYREATRLTDQRFANWREGEIVRQLERNARSPVVNGSIFFRERFMRGDVGDAIGAFYSRHLPGQVPTRPGSGANPPQLAPPAQNTPANNLPVLTIPPPPMPNLV
ncbi:MAG: family 10 glycosylhydrolase, partial [Defluviitaleaceae bacterium]|nr:family 10 glycosylhydrolase [Defluviitaleaceae bacterium]